MHLSKLLLLSLSITSGVAVFAQPNIIQQAADVCPGICNGNPMSFTSFQGKLYFTAKHPTAGRELHVWDGTTVSLVQDLEPGPADGFTAYPPNDHQFTEINGKLYMVAVPSSTSSTMMGSLWSYDGSGPITQVIVDPAGQSNIAVSDIQMRALGGKLYLGIGSTGFPSSWLCSYDPTTNDTTLIPYTAATVSAARFPRHLTALSGVLYYSATSATPTSPGYFLYRYDPAAGLAQRITNTRVSIRPAGWLNMAAMYTSPPVSRLTTPALCAFTGRMLPAP